MNHFLLSVVIPVYNEEQVLAANTRYLAGEFDRIVGAGAWQYVIVDNGSTDATPALLRQVAETWPTKILHADEPNYGKALRTGLEGADTEWVHSIDIEQWDIPFFEWAWNNREQHDIFIGSKRADPTLNRQPVYRKFLSWGLNCLIQLFFEHMGTDTHGPKLLRLSALKPIISQCRMSRGQFDTEFVLRSVRAGLRLVEAPVIYEEQRPARRLMLEKIYINIREFNRLRIMMKGIGFSGLVRYRRVCREDVLAQSQASSEAANWIHTT